MTPGPSFAEVDEMAAGLDADLITLRREIHRWPELAGEERRTAALVADRLRAAGLAVTTGVGGHGVVAVLDGTGDGPTVAYRADMDAVGVDNVLPYQPSGRVFDADFASQVPEVAHLCGHDLHTAIGVGVAEVLARLRHHLPGRVVFLFQPAEETLGGARAMIDAGVLERHASREIYALHCGPTPVGSITVMPGGGLPGQDWVRLELTGPTAAAAADRLVATIAALSTVELPRTPEQFQLLFADLRTAGGRSTRFVVARCTSKVADARARVSVQLRAWPDDQHPKLRDEIAGFADTLGASIEFPSPPFPGMVCTPDLSEAAVAYLQSAIGRDAVRVVRTAWPFGSEDFALFLQRVPGAMFFLGVGNPAAGINGVPHSPDFAADEQAIGLGVRAMAGFLSSRLHAGAATQHHVVT